MHAVKTLGRGHWSEGALVLRGSGLNFVMVLALVLVPLGMRGHVTYTSGTLMGTRSVWKLLGLGGLIPMYHVHSLSNFQ